MPATSLGSYNLGTRTRFPAIAFLAVLMSPLQAVLANDDTTLEEIVVSGVKQVSVTKSDVPLLETPQNIQILSGGLLKDQGAVLLDDALRNVAGVMPGGYYNGYDYYRIRGFDASSSTFLDGLLFFNGVSQSTEISGLERVEVIKGPPSALYGQGSLGGMVNLVSKHPTREPFTDIQVTGGNYSFYDAQADIDRPLNSNGTVYGRLDLIYRHTSSYVDFADGDRRIYAAPSLTWDIDDDTRLTVLGKYQNDLGELAPPLPADGTVLANPNGQIPFSRYAGDANNPGTVAQWRAFGGYELTHRFNDNLSIRQDLRATWGDQHWDNLLYPFALLDDERTLLRYPYALRDREQDVAADTALQAKFSTGGFEHTLISGVDYRWYYDTATNFQIDYSDPGSYVPLDLFNPVYEHYTPNFAASRTFFTRTVDLGVYVQDQVKISALTVTVGGRYDTADTGATGSDHKDHAFVPRVGFTYEIVPGIAPYASYSKSFTPQVGLDNATGQQVRPETGANWELGLKTALMGGRLNTTTAIYQLTRQNVATSDPTNPDFYVVTGEQRSRGFEFDGQFKVNESLELILAYSHIDGKVTKDNIIPVGDKLQNVPAENLNGWVRYGFRGGPLNGLSASLGGSYYSSQAADLPNTFDLPAYALVNANLTYSFGKARVQLNGRNLLDRRYFTGSYNNLYVLPGHPRTAQLTLEYSF
jgi:iron complex outermembrane recepter protein